MFFFNLCAMAMPEGPAPIIIALVIFSVAHQNGVGFVVLFVGDGHRRCRVRLHAKTEINTTAPAAV